MCAVAALVLAAQNAPLPIRPFDLVMAISMRRPFSKIEDSLEFIVERPFSMLFRRSIQPADVGKRLKKELTSGGITSVRGKVAPNDFVVQLNPDDAAPYLEHSRVLGDDLAEWLEEIAMSSNLTTLGAMRVRFESDPNVRAGRFDVQATVQDVDAAPVPYVDPGMTEPFEVVGRRGTAVSGYIEVCSGPSTGAMFPVRKQVITVGRDLSNDLVIENAEVSRYHAELHHAGGALSVADLNSMNGTYVNGVQVRGSQIIASGDQIIFGTTICRYWHDLL